MNQLVKASERIAYGYVDIRAMWGTGEPDFWHVIWMAVSCCCGLQGPAEVVTLPRPNPDVIHAPT